jgi:hypothetical protein
VRDLVQRRRCSRLRHERVVAVADHEASDLMQQRRAGRTLDLPPQLVRPPHQRHVLGALADRDARDPCVAVRGAAIVRWPEAVDADHPQPAPGQLERDRAPHRAEAGDDRVEPLRPTHARIAVRAGRRITGILHRRPPGPRSGLRSARRSRGSGTYWTSLSMSGDMRL